MGRSFGKQNQVESILLYAEKLIHICILSYIFSLFCKCQDLLNTAGSIYPNDLIHRNLDRKFLNYSAIKSIKIEVHGFSETAFIVSLRQWCSRLVRARIAVKTCSEGES